MFAKGQHRIGAPHPEHSQHRVRPYTPADRAAVRAIAVATAARGDGANKFFDDEELIADYLCSYYTDHDPEHVWIAESADQVVGYCFGCRCSGDFSRVMARRVVPRLLLTALYRLWRGAYVDRPQNRRFLLWLFWRAWREQPRFHFEPLAAHYHCNLLPSGYGHRLFTALALSCLAGLRQMGVQRIHVQVTESASRGPFQRMAHAFFVSHPDIPFSYAETASTMQRFVLDDPRPMVNRVWGGDLANYVAFLYWIRSHYRI